MTVDLITETNNNCIIWVEHLVLRAGQPAFDLSVAPGEIIGLAGLEGHGQEEFLKVLAGLRRPYSGRVLVGSRRGEGDGIRELVSGIVAYVPRDRGTEGIFPSMTVLDNFAIGSLGRFSQFGFLRRRKVSSAFREAKANLGIIVESPLSSIMSLSGGNQQKVLLARALALKPAVLLLNDPTRGVDGNAKESFYQIFRTLAREENLAVILLSTELKELVELCHRVLVFREGRLGAACAVETLAESNILAAMFGESSAPRTSSDL